MPELVMNNNEIAVCPCGGRQFEILPHKELPKSPMAFCSNCKRGKALSLWQQDLNVGFVMKNDFQAAQIIAKKPTLDEQFEFQERHGE
jgi:hypothetical protein